LEAAVEALLHSFTMHLLNATTLEVHQFIGKIPEYVILSHTWEEEEVTFDDIDMPHAKGMAGYEKIKKCCEQARRDGYRWVWIDTCCIDKRSSAELSEAINSMYNWYWNAEKCYAYLSTVNAKEELQELDDRIPTLLSEEIGVPESPDEYSETEDKGIGAMPEWQYTLYRDPVKESRRLERLEASRADSWKRKLEIEQQKIMNRKKKKLEEEKKEIKDKTLFGNSRWFTRGWTLQEFLAPAIVEFYDKYWKLLGTKSSLAAQIVSVTNIQARYILDRKSISNANIGLRFSWASERETTRTEDIAYCLLGLVGVHMPLLYGEGKQAFYRLQLEILKKTTDHTMFAWTPRSAPSSDSVTVSIGSENTTSVFASFFASSPDLYHPRDLANIPENTDQRAPNALRHEMTNLGLRISLPLLKRDDGSLVAILNCEMENKFLAGVPMVQLAHPRFARRKDWPLEYMTENELSKSHITEMYIVTEVTMNDSGEDKSCAFKVNSLSIEGLTGANFRALEMLIDMKKTITIRRAQDIVKETVELNAEQAVALIVHLHYPFLTIVFGHRQGCSWLGIVLSASRQSSSALLADLTTAMKKGGLSEYLCDHAEAYFEQRLWVQVRVRKTMVWPEGRPCWQLAIDVQRWDEATKTMVQ
jgi:hypothetical protein